MKFSGIVLGSQLLLAVLAAPAAAGASLAVRKVEYASLSARSLNGIDAAKRGVESMLQTLSTRSDLDTDEDGDLGSCGKRSLDNLEVAKRELEIMSLKTKRSDLDTDEDGDLGSCGKRALSELEMAQGEIESMIKRSDLDTDEDGDLGSCGKRSLEAVKMAKRDLQSTTAKLK